MLILRSFFFVAIATFFHTAINEKLDKSLASEGSFLYGWR